jgi:hypothetical protein
MMPKYLTDLVLFHARKNKIEILLRELDDLAQKSDVKYAVLKRIAELREEEQTWEKPGRTLQVKNLT